MSDEEYYEEEEVEEEYEEEEEEEYEEEEEGAETRTNPDERKSVRSAMSEGGDGNFLKARQEAKKGELDEQLKEYINEWRKQRSKEEEELKRLKEKQAKRKEIRAEQEQKLAKQKKEEEERLRKEEAEKKAKEAEEKRKRLEEAEKKRQAMMQAQKDKQSAGGNGKGGQKKADGGMANVQDARREMTKTKEQLEEEKKISLSIRIKPLELDEMDSDSLKSKANELWETIVRLETEKYDLEERQRRQELMRTEENFTKGVGMFCMLNSWRKHGKRKWTNGAKGPRPSCPNGLVRDLARSPENPSPLMMRKMDLLKYLQE